MAFLQHLKILPTSWYTRKTGTTVLVYWCNTHINNKRDRKLIWCSTLAISNDFGQNQWINGRFIFKLKLLLLPSRFSRLCAKSWLIGKEPDTGKEWKQEEKGITEDEMVGWHHWINGHEFEQAPGVGDGQGTLACYSPWGWTKSWTQLSTGLHWSIWVNSLQC